MTLEERVSKLEINLKRLTNAVLQMSDNDSKQVARVDNNENQLTAITPYTETKIGYYGEREKTFYGVPMGNVTVMFNNYNGDYSVGRIADRVMVSFDTLNEQTQITISVL